MKTIRRTLEVTSRLSFTAFFGAILICSCSASAPVKTEPQRAAPGIEQDYHSIETLVRAGDYKKALPRLKRFVQQNPVNDLTANAYYLMGEIYQNGQKYNDALTSYLAVINLPVASTLEPEATLKAARLQLRMSQNLEAEQTLERAARWKNPTTDQLLDAEKLRYEAFVAQKKYLQAERALVVLSTSGTSASEHDRYKAMAQELLETRLGEDDVREVADNKAYGFLQPLAQFRYGLMLAEQHQYSKSHDYLSSVASAVPGTELADRANRILNQLDARNRVDSHTIGVVLPLSGKQAGIGYKALRGIQLGLGIYGAKVNSGFHLAVIDSEGNPDQARRAVERLVQEDNVIAIIGGLLSRTASAEATKAQEFGVPAIMLSQKSGVTQAGDYIFRNSLTSQMQVQALVDTAMTRLGMHNFAILYPNDAYGVEFANLFWDEVSAHGGTVTGAQPYDSAETDFRTYVQRLVGNFYLEDRSDEYRLYSKQWTEKNPKRSARSAPPAPEELMPPIVDFDAVFIPDSAKAIGQIAPMLAYNNISGVRLLGTNIWNSPSFITRGQKFVDNAVFVDSYLATDPSFVNSEFFASFKSSFDEEPGLTEVQSYDSALILRQLIASGNNTRGSLQAKMLHLDNFPGAIGPISANAEREFRRPVEALTVKDGHISTLESIKR